MKMVPTETRTSRDATACPLGIHRVLKFKWPLLAAIIVLLSITAFLFWKKHPKTHDTALSSHPVPVSVITVHDETLSINATASGYLQATKNTTITPRVSGYIQSIPFRAGDQVNQGDLLFQLDNTQEKNALSAAEANDTLSRLQYQRNKELLKKGFITQEVYYTSKVTMKQNAAALKTAQTDLANKTVTAPFSGTLGEIKISIGDYITPGTALTTLVDNQHCRVSYTLPLRDLPLIKLHQPVTITSDITQHKTSADVSFISPTVDQDTQTILLNATFNNDQNAFKPGEFVSISQHITDNQHAIFIPEQSVLADLNGYSVYIVKNNKAVQIPVKVGSRQTGKILITAGLKPSMQLIVEGQTQVHDGEQVALPHSS